MNEGVQHAAQFKDFFFRRDTNLLPPVKIKRREPGFAPFVLSV
jgi:hypothetical protein